MGTSYSVVVTGKDLQDLAEQVNAKFREVDETLKELKEASQKADKPKPAIKKAK